MTDELKSIYRALLLPSGWRVHRQTKKANGRVCIYFMKDIDVWTYLKRPYIITLLPCEEENDT